MKKRQFKNLTLNKKTVSNFKSNSILGGNELTNRCIIEEPQTIDPADCETPIGDTRNDSLGLLSCPPLCA